MSDRPIPPALAQDVDWLLGRLPALCPEAAPGLVAGWGEQILHYVSLLYAWSGHINLVSGRDRLALASRHVLPSLAMRTVLLRFPHRIVADLGSGSGLPGVPLKISLPQVPFQLIEARRRRANFLREVSRRLSLEPVEVVNRRVEDWDCAESQKPDIIVSRAVMAPDLLASCCARLLRPGGHVLFALTSSAPEEVAEGSNAPLILETGIEDHEGRHIRIGMLRPDLPPPDKTHW